MANFKDRFKELRKEKDLGQKEIGALLGYSESTISLYESGKREPKTAEDFIKIADFFKVTLDYLMGISDERQNTTVKYMLTPKDKKDIEKRLEKIKTELMESQDGLMLSGNPVSPEAIQSIVDALEFGMRQAKVINKKYIPKKYREDKDE